MTFQDSQEILEPWFGTVSDSMYADNVKFITADAMVAEKYNK